MQVAVYDRMCIAIADCHRIDEVKDLRDKAMALELYAKQARNTDAERKASEVRLRAERRTGELLQELARGQGARRDITSPKHADKSSASEYSKALTDTGISTQTASRYQALANVPTQVFEQAQATGDVKLIRGFARELQKAIERGAPAA